MHHMDSRSSPSGLPDQTSRLLRELRSATRTYILSMEAGLAALEVPENDPELQTIRTALRVATGARSSGAGYAFGAAINLERLLSAALGEEETTTT